MFPVALVDNTTLPPGQNVAEGAGLIVGGVRVLAEIIVGREVAKQPALLVTVTV